MASEYQKRLIKSQQARAKAGVTMSNDPRRKSSRSSSRGSKSKLFVTEAPLATKSKSKKRYSGKTIIRDASGRVIGTNVKGIIIGQKLSSTEAKRLTSAKEKAIKIRDTSKRNQGVTTDNRSQYYTSNGKLIDRKTGQTINLSTVGGNLTKGIDELKKKTTATYTGQIKGKVYKNLTQEELLQNRLMGGSVATELQEKTQQRSTYISSQQRLKQGVGTSFDLINVLSKGTGRVENILAKSTQARQLSRTQQIARFRKEAEKKSVPEIKKETKNNFNLVWAATPKRSLLQRAIAELNYIQSSNIKTRNDLQRKAPTVYNLAVRGILLPTVYGAARGVVGVINTVVHPVKTVKAMAQGLIRPVDTFKALTTALANDPMAVIAEFYVYNKVISAPSKYIKPLKKLPKGGKTKAKVGTIYKTPKGDLRIVTKGGKIVKVPKKVQSAYDAAQKLGEKARQKKTKVARTTKKVLKGKGTKKDIKVVLKSQKGIKAKKIQAEINTFSRRYKLPKDIKAEYSKIYSKFRNNPTQKNAAQLKKFADSLEVRLGVRNLDKRIIANLKNQKTAQAALKKVSKVRKVVKRKKLTPKQRAKRIREKELGEQGRFIERAKRKKAKEVKVAQKKVDVAARKKGFKDYKEEFTYSEALKKYLKGDKKSIKTLERIEKAIKKRRDIASKKRLKIIRKTQNRLIREGLIKLARGKLKIQSQSPSAKLFNKRQKVILKEFDKIKQKKIKTFDDIERIDKLYGELQKAKQDLKKRVSKPKRKVEVKTGKGLKQELVVKQKLTPKQRTRVKSTLKRVANNRKIAARTVSTGISIANLKKPTQDKVISNVNKIDRALDNLKKSDNLIEKIIDKLPKQESAVASALKKEQKQTQNVISKLRNTKTRLKTKTLPKVRKALLVKPKLRKPKVTKKVIKKKKKKSIKGKRAYTATIGGAKKRATAKRRKTKRFTGIEVRGR